MKTINQSRARKLLSSRWRTRLAILDNRGGTNLALPHGMIITRKSRGVNNPKDRDMKLRNRKNQSFMLIVPDHLGAETISVKHPPARSKYTPHEGKKQQEKRVRQIHLHSSNDY